MRAVADGAEQCDHRLDRGGPALDGPRYRDELRGGPPQPLLAASTMWLAAELVRLVLATAEAAGRSAGNVGLHTVWDFSVETAPARSGGW